MFNKKSYKLSKEEILKIHTDVTLNFIEWVNNNDYVSEAQKPLVIQKKLQELKALA